jgi:hypothetical protein
LADFGFWATAALATIPLAGAVGGFVSQTLIAGRNVYISSITAERSKWLDKLRTNLSTYYSASSSMKFRIEVIKTFTEKNKADLDVKDMFDSLEKLEELASLLRLQLNPQGLIDGNVIELIEAVELYQNVDHHSVSDLRNMIISHSQWLLKAEWEKVKWEAGGYRYHRKHKGDADLYLSQYALWAANEGNFDALMEQAKTHAKAHGPQKAAATNPS